MLGAFARGVRVRGVVDDAAKEDERTFARPEIRE